MVRLVKHFVPACVLDSSSTGYLHGTHCLLPFDAYHDPVTGERDMNQTTMVYVCVYVCVCVCMCVCVCVVHLSWIAGAARIINKNIYFL